MPIPLRLLAFLTFAALASVRALRGPRPDVIFMTSTPLTIALPGMLARIRWRAPLVFEVRDLVLAAAVESGYLRSKSLIWMSSLIEDLAYQTSTHIVALSPAMRDAIIAGGVRPAKISVIPNCCDAELYAPARREPVRRRLGIGDDVLLCLYAGSMGPIYGTSLLAEVAQVLQKNGSRLRIVALGDGADRPLLEQQVQTLGLDNITVLPPVAKREMRNWLAACDVGIAVVRDFPVLSTCSPNKFFDFLAAGRPVVMTYGGWMADLLHLHDAGINVPAGRPDLLAEALLELERNPERIGLMGQNAHKLGRELFQRDQLAVKLIAVLESAAMWKSA
jgi:glycosyltransferase involved in cell wall biosynthesis